MIDYDAIKTSLVRIFADAVGTDLSTIGNPPVPAVIRDRQNGKIPKYPYIVIDKTDEDDQDGWLTDWSVDENDQATYSTDKFLLFRVTCYGVEGTQIMQKLKSRLRFESYRNRLRNEVGAAFFSETSVKEAPEVRGVEWIENGYIDLTLSVNDTETDTSSTTIDTISATGTVKDVLDGTIDTVEINIP